MRAWHTESKVWSSWFGRIAEEYDRYRPRVPESLLAEIVDVIPNLRGRVLEVGCGTGQTTQGLAPLCEEVVAVEPSAGMARVARSNLAGLDHVSVESSTFEDVDVPPGGFDAIVASNSWHWVNPDVGYAKAHRILVPRGSVCFLWHMVVGYTPEGFREAANAVIEEVAPTTGTPVPQDVGWIEPYWIVEALRDSQLFDVVDSRVVPVTCTLDAKSFVGALNTSRGLRPSFGDTSRALEDLIDREFAGSIERHDDILVVLGEAIA